jgi:hypothetical protein
MDENPLREHVDLEYQNHPEVQRNLLIEAAVSRGLPPNFLINLAGIESANEENPRTATGKKELEGGGRARGILQFIPSTAAAYKIDPLNVKQSADAAADMAAKNLVRLRRNFPKMSESELLHLAGVAHHSGMGNVMQARGVPQKPYALDYSKKLRAATERDKRTLRDAINFPVPPEVKNPKPARPSGAASQPMRKGSLDIYDIQQMYGNVGTFPPGINVLGDPVT